MNSINATRITVHLRNGDESRRTPILGTKVYRSVENVERRGNCRTANIKCLRALNLRCAGIEYDRRTLERRGFQVNQRRAVASLPNAETVRNVRSSTRVIQPHVALAIFRVRLRLIAAIDRRQAN